jgi:hypothetical protein
MASKGEDPSIDKLVEEAEKRGFTIVLGKDLRLSVGKEKDLSIEIGKKKGPGLSLQLGLDHKPEVKLYGSSNIPKKESTYKNERMQSIDVLKDCMSHTDEDVFNALCYFDTKKLSQSPVAALEKGKHLFAACWRLISKTYKEGNKDFFSLVFGTPRKYSWYSWNTFDQERFDAFVHESERQLRKYLKAGRSLKEKPSESWVSPYVQTVIKADVLEEKEAAKPKININFEDLDKIRSDAGVTRDWLLTEEDMDELMPGAEEVNGSLKTGDTSCEEHTATVPETLPLGLDALHLSIVEALLLGEITDDIIKENHMMASVAADRINEAFFDEIGDNILECEDGRLSLVEEYKEDVRSLLGV